MSWHKLAGVRRELRGHIREWWARLTGNNMGVLAGQHDQLIGKIQRRYGSAAEQAERRAIAREARARRIIIPR
jgi:uncharacterized protein YjbJ (UPF0337 family)